MSVTSGNRSMIALPHNGLRITCAHLRMIEEAMFNIFPIDLDPEIYVAQLAPARTFYFYEDIEDLLEMGKIRGGSLDSAMVYQRR